MLTGIGSHLHKSPVRAAAARPFAARQPSRDHFVASATIVCAAAIMEAVLVGGGGEMNTVIVGVLVVLAASTSSAVAQQQRTHQLPTATEVFNLRSRCAALGERILEGNTIGPALTQ
jgi:hypothetical protein